MLQSLAEGLVEKLKSSYGINGHIQGRPSDGWMVADYGDVVIHLFSPDQRNYYRLEELWDRGRVLLRLQ
jgi:ribosome-associated protein